MDSVKIASFLIGTVFVSIGGGIAGISMAEHDVLMTTAGFIVAALGYRTIQVGFRERELLEFQLKDVSFSLKSFLKYLEIFVGLLIFSYGFVLAVESSYSLEVVKMISSGFVIVSGYFVLHRGMNGVII